MLQPKKTKFNKVQKGRNHGVSKSFLIKFGTFGLKSISRGQLTAKQIEAARKVISRTIKRSVKIWIRIFPDKPITKKPIETRMGKGKGEVQYWVSIIKPGTILYEMDKINIDLAKKAFRLASFKLPLKTMFVEI